MKKPSVGGQALIEGVMMKGPDRIAMAVRMADGQIDVKVDEVTPVSQKNKLFSLPVVRGSVNLIDSMVTGVKSLTYSAQFFEEEEDSKPSKFDNFLNRVFKDKAEDVMVYLAIFIAIISAVGIFILGPSLLSDLLRIWTKNRVIINVAEGIIRIAAFVGYIAIISKLEDIQRVFQYHGAEHKAIHCYESGRELTVENAKQFTTLHPRCGTSFLLIVMVISIVTFSFLGLPNPLVKALIRILMLPVIAGISYEILKWTGKSNSRLVAAISYPGMMLQKMTTREPDDSQLEVALRALEGALPPKGEDKIEE